MEHYSVFGGCLRSEIHFPELRPVVARKPNWTLRKMAVPPSEHGAELMGEDIVDGALRVRLYTTAAGFRLDYDDTGSFEIKAAGEIEWWPGRDFRLEAVRLDVLGRVLPAALHQTGDLCLHGSAVALGSAGLAFLAPKLHGKSTLAQALVESGARLAADDVIPVTTGAAAVMRPGVSRVRLWSDSADRLASGQRPQEWSGSKRLMQTPSEERLLDCNVPLAAIYLLAPIRPDVGATPAHRVRYPPVAATASLVGHARMGPLLGSAGAASVLNRAAAVAGAVPVYSLRIVRDFEQLPRVVEQLWEWHAGPGAPERCVEAAL